MRYCKKCKKEVKGGFCPDCKGMTILKPEVNYVPLGTPGDSFECTIWQGPNDTRGIRIGAHRDRYFSKRHSRIVLYLDNVRCLVELTEGFWHKCPEIRFAVNDSGENYLDKWIRKHGLQPLGTASMLRGGADIMMLEVVVPEEEFRVKIKEGSGRA